MNMKLQCILGVLGFIAIVPTLSSAGTIKIIPIVNNLYNQASGNTGSSASDITVQYYNGLTLCDTAIITFRQYRTEQVGTGANQACPNVTSLQFIAGTSTYNPSYQVYATAPILVSLDDTKYVHSIIIQDLGTGTMGVPAIDGSIAPIFDSTNGQILTLGIMGTVLVEH